MLFPSILNSSIFVQCANVAGKAESWLYLGKTKSYLIFKDLDRSILQDLNLNHIF